MKTQAAEPFRKKCQFAASLRYELFYSLGALLDPGARIHPGWRRLSRASLGTDFERALKELGGSWEIWPVLAALLPGPLANPNFEDVLESLRRLPLAEFKDKILRGLLHDEGAVASLMKEKTSLKSALAKIPRAKREWIAHIGLFPYDERSPQVIALESLVAEPEHFRKCVLRVLEIYWKKCFAATWERLLPQLRRSLEARERLFHSCSFAEFAEQSLLRIKVDDDEIQAIRGGYRLRLKDIEACYFLPSAFNDRRFWSAFKDEGRQTTVYFPFFDPAITLDLQLAGESARLTEPALDPALIFKALGDSTRFAIASLLARKPMSSVELAKTLAVSKPTISHHVHLLREAGLLNEVYSGGSVELQLKRSTVEALSALTISKLFASDEPLALTRSRGGSAHESK